MKKQRYVVEVVEEKKSCLLVYSQKTRYTAVVKKYLAKNYTVFETTKTEGYKKDFDLVVYINTPFYNKKELIKNKLNVFIFFFNKEEYEEQSRWSTKHLKNYKVVNIGPIHRSINELVEFVLYRTPVPYSFSFAKNIKHKQVKIFEPKMIDVIWFFSKTVFFMILALNALYFLSFAYEWWLIKAVWDSRGGEFNLIRKEVDKLERWQLVNDKLVLVPKNTLFWLPINNVIFDLHDSTKITVDLLGSGAGLVENYSALSKLVIKQSKTTAELKEIRLRLTKLKAQFKKTKETYYGAVTMWRKTETPFINKKKNQLLEKATKIEPYMDLAEKLNEHLPYILGEKKPRKYLVLFMNNMELRPGGGFIGSLAVVEFVDYSLKKLMVYDVYTLDGQLKTHLDPPSAIREHLNQPHWFLRDSNFSPDFSENAKNALKFVDLEVGWDDFDGVFGVTLSAVQKIIEALPELYVGDYDETVTADNFFIKAQTYAEKEFFPGSHGKKNFLEAVFRSLILRLEDGNFDYWGLGQRMVSILDEKLVTLYFKNVEIESFFDNLFWTGRMVEAKCNFNDNCFVDYLMLADANLGVNKANFFVQRSVRLSTNINKSGAITNNLVIDYINESVNDVFPGGVYKNYFQVYLPKLVKVEKVMISGNDIEYDEILENSYRKLGFLLTVPAQSTRSVRIVYSFKDQIQNKDQQYQLVVQKQIGSINTDFIYEMSFPGNITFLQTNFEPIVDKSGFVYNTYLQRDRILLVDLKVTK